MAARVAEGSGGGGASSSDPAGSGLLSVLASTRVMKDRPIDADPPMGGQSQRRNSQAKTRTLWGKIRPHLNPDCGCDENPDSCQAQYVTDEAKACLQCTRGSDYKKGHAKTCPRFKYAGQTHGEAHRAKDSAKSSKQTCVRVQDTNWKPPTQAETDAFIGGSRTSGTTTGSALAIVGTPASSPTPVNALASPQPTQRGGLLGASLDAANYVLRRFILPRSPPPQPPQEAAAAVVRRTYLCGSCGVTEGEFYVSADISVQLCGSCHNEREEALRHRGVARPPSRRLLKAKSYAEGDTGSDGEEEGEEEEEEEEEELLEKTLRVMPWVSQTLKDECNALPKVHKVGSNRGLPYPEEARKKYKEQYKPGASYSPRARPQAQSLNLMALSFATGMSVITWPEEIDTSSATKPDLKVHATRGLTLHIVRWELNYERDRKVDEALHCTCGAPLEFVRMSLAQESGKFIVIFRGGGQRPSIAVQARYKCTGETSTGEACNNHFGATDPHILHGLGRYGGDYPCSPEWSTPRSSIQFARSFEESLDTKMVTYENGDAVMRSELSSLSCLYDRHVNDYESHVADWKVHHPTDEFPHFPSFELWAGSRVPSGGLLRKRYEAAHYMPLGPASRHVFRTRQIQSVTTDTACSTDHTHDAAKNFDVGKGAPKATKVWNCVTGNLLVACMLLTKDTSSTEFIHAAEELAHREGWHPMVHYTDTWPSQKKMWACLWIECIGRLGVFHWMKRMADHMRKHHEKFGLCMRELSCTVFSFDEDTVNAVERALADGTLNGKVHTPEEIQELHSSGVFMRRYKKYIKRATLSVPTINSKLNTWYTKWKDEYDDKIGERIFFPPMIDRHTDALAHIDDIVDPDLNLYIELRKKTRQKHDLQQLSCQRGEKVEIFHAQQGDFSNGGCRARLAQAQTIEGAVMFTMDRQQEANYHSGTVSSPVVPNYRLWVRLAANREARRSGRRVPFPDAVEPRPDSRERFLYDYYLEQLEREKSGLFTGELTHCPCDSCSARRETCDCLACSSFRRRDAGLTDDQADELLVELTRNPDACADELES